LRQFDFRELLFRCLVVFERNAVQSETSLERLVRCNKAPIGKGNLIAARQNKSFVGIDDSANLRFCRFHRRMPNASDLQDDEFERHGAVEGAKEQNERFVEWPSETRDSRSGHPSALGVCETIGIRREERSHCGESYTLFGKAVG